MAVLAVLVLLTMPVLGGWLMMEELIPVTMEVTEETLTVTRVGTTYEIELNEIEQVQLLEKLPPSVRVWGTGMPNLLKGSFSVEGYGMCELCVNPEAPPFLLVETTKKTYILGTGNVEEIASLLQP